MKQAARVAMILVAGLWVLAAPQTSAGTGGHGGGHSSQGSSAGHAMGSAGRSVGHSIGHSIGHFFGRRGKTGGSQASRPSAALADRKSVPQPNGSIFLPPSVRPAHHNPGEAFFFEQPFASRHHGRFGFGGCPGFGFPTNGFFRGNGFDCFNSWFFFSDPFFFGFSSSSWSASPTWLGSGPSSLMEAPLQASPAESEVVEGKSPDASAENEAERDAKREAAVTLLQLRDGWMYGLTEYWVDGDELHYITTYGGEGSVPIQRIDLEATAKLNRDRGVEFVLKPKPVPQPR